MKSKLFTTFQSLLSFLSIFLLLDTQFGVPRSGRNTERQGEKRRKKEQISDNKENHCVPETDEPKVACSRTKNVRTSRMVCKLYRIK